MTILRIPIACLALAVTMLRAEPSPDALLREGIQAFFDAKPAESVAAFDKLIALAPNTAPQLWQRGLSLYYAEKFAEGRKQFELHQTVNPDDVENAAWHFICVAKTDGVDAARNVFIPIEGDTRVPMKEVHLLFAGKGTEADIMKVASASEDLDARRNHLCYAHLYLGLYHEALGNKDKAKEHMLKSAVDYKMDHYMGKCAQVHVKLRGWDTKPPQAK
jgi:lipoprotein NlpI